MSPVLVLDEIADAILDGIPVDWSTIDLNDTPEDQELIEQLRTLAALRLGRSGDMPKPLGTGNWGHLEVFERIGQGAYGDVYRAWDTRLDREVALKLMPADVPSAAPSASIVIEEGRLLARVRHPNVATIYGAERIGGRVGLWMEFIKGRTLEQALRSGRTFTAAEVTRLGVDLCRAVSAVHAAGLLHRDIKTQNVMLDDNGRLVLMDFGTGRELDDAREGRIAGTPLYLAPEVLAGKPATPRSDVYAIGVVLFRLLTNTYPVSGSNLADLRRAHAAGGDASARVDREEIPQRLRRVLARAIDPDPNRRYEGADAMAAALQRVPASRRLAYGVAAAAAIAAVVAGGWNLGLRQLTRPALLALGLATPKIAVLPFTNVGSDPGHDDFVDGLTIEVIRDLGSLDGLQVSQQRSSFHFKKQPRDPHDFAKQLDVDLVVDATVQRVGNRIRIHAQLLPMSGDVPVWQDKYDRTLDDVFAIQDEISRAIVNQLRLTLGRGQRRYTSMAVYDLYMKGRALVMQRGTDKAAQAAKVFAQVIEMDHAFAPAHAGLAEAYAAWSWQLDGGMSADDGIAAMRPAAEQALHLDPLLAEAHGAMGLTYARELEWENAKASFEEALRLSPSSSDLRASYAISTLVPLGELRQAQRLLAVASNLDPYSLAIRRDLGIAQYYGGRYQDAVVNLQQVSDTDPAFQFVANMLARSLTQVGRPADAIELYLNRPGNKPIGSDRWLMPAYVKLGRQNDIDRLIEQHKDTRARPYQQAIVYAGLSDKDRTFDALNRAVDDSPQRTAPVLMYPEMAFLRGDPRFDDLKKRLNLR